MDYKSKRIAITTRPNPEIALYFDHCYCLHGHADSTLMGPIEALTARDDSKYPSGYFLNPRNIGFSSSDDKNFVVERSLKLLQTELRLTNEKDKQTIKHLLNHYMIYDTGATKVSEEIESAEVYLSDRGFARNFSEDLAIMAVTNIFREKGEYTVPIVRDLNGLTPWAPKNSLEEGIELSLLNLPIVDTGDIKWDHVKEVRSDRRSIAALRNLRLFLDDIDPTKGKEYVQDVILNRVEEYERAAKKHGFKLLSEPLKALLKLKHLPKLAIYSLISLLVPSVETSAVLATFAAAEIQGVVSEIGELSLSLRSQHVLRHLGESNHQVEYLVKIKEAMKG